jgi:hypothetical protein
VTLRREVTAAAAGAATEQEFLERLAEAGVLVRLRHSEASPGQVTGYAVGLASHTSRDGGVIWFGGGKLAADLTLPKLRAHWAAAAGAMPSGEGLPASTARAILRNAVTRAAGRAGDEAGFITQLREAGVLVRLRYSQTDPGQVTGYAVTLPGHTGNDGAPAWYGGGRLAAGLTLPRLRRSWDSGQCSVPGRSGAFRFTAPERDAIYAHAARQATAAADHIRHCAYRDPRGAADAAHAAAGALHVAARTLRSPELRCAADAYDRAARTPYGRLPRQTRDGSQLRATARLLGLLGNGTGDAVFAAAGLVASFAVLADAVAELRQAQQHAAQTAAARTAAEQVHAAMARSRSVPSHPLRRPGPAGPVDTARDDVPTRPHPQRPAAASPEHAPSRPRAGSRAAMPGKRAGPAP